MPSEVLKLTTEIVVSHASMTELTPEQLVNEIKAVYNVLASLDGGAILEEPAEARPKLAGEETVCPFERYRQGQICGLPGMRQEDADLKGPYPQGSWPTAERILSSGLASIPRNSRWCAKNTRSSAAKWLRIEDLG